MNDFVEKIVADLRAFSGELLDPGLAPAAAARASAGPHGSASLLLDWTRRLSLLMPTLLSELESSDAPNRVVDHYTFSPIRATLSRRPCDYQSAQTALLVPVRWRQSVPVLVPEVKALRWLLCIVLALRAALDRTRARSEKQVSEALAARRGGSRWAESDQVALHALSRRISEAQFRIERCVAHLARAAGEKLLPSATPPSPYPKSPAWSSLRNLAAQILDPARVLAAMAAQLLGDSVEAADVPTLYQRWCGLHLIDALRRHGWTLDNDPVGPLFLGGCIRFRKGHGRLDLWVEARITRQRDHASGFYCVHGEDATPDFLIVTAGAGGLDAFVLDATKTCDDAVLRDKDRYLRLLMGATATRIAGVPVVRRPLRSWAVAPSTSTFCRVDASDGSRGVVPLHPLEFTREPLMHWVADVDRHARAWGIQ